MSILSNNDAIEDIKCWVNNNSSDIEYVYTQDGKLVFSKYTEIEDSLPLLYNSKKNNLALKNYRIYGNTVDSESVGDRTENLFDSSIIVENGTINTETGADSSYQSQKRLRTSFIGFLSAGTYTVNLDGVNRVNCIALYSSQNPDDFIETISNTGLLPKSFTLNEGGYIRIAFSKTDNSNISLDDISNIMLNAGSKSLPYEPYGYRVPVTVTNGTDTQTTNLYLTEQIKLVGDEAEYIDYAEQKQHFADGTSIDVALPALPILSGTNILSIDTNIQPSSIYLKGKITAPPAG